MTEGGNDDKPNLRLPTLVNKSLDSYPEISSAPMYSQIMGPKIERYGDDREKMAIIIAHERQLRH